MAKRREYIVSFSFTSKKVTAKRKVTVRDYYFGAVAGKSWIQGDSTDKFFIEVENHSQDDMAILPKLIIAIKNRIVERARKEKQISIRPEELKVKIKYLVLVN